MKKQEDRHPVPATNLGPKPADFPLGSLESRAAARIMAMTRAEREVREPIVYKSIFDRPNPAPWPPLEEPYPLFPEPPKKDDDIASSPLPAPGDSLNDDPPAAPEPLSPPSIIIVEIG